MCHSVSGSGGECVTLCRGVVGKKKGESGMCDSVSGSGGENGREDSGRFVALSLIDGVLAFECLDSSSMGG